jgi:hypothetical protein
MSQPPIEPLPDDIASLLAREKDAYPVDPAAQRAVLSRVEMAIALGAGGAGGAGGHGSPPGTAGGGHVVARAAKTGIAGKMIAVALAAFVGGGLTGGAIVKTMTKAPALAPVAALVPATSAASALPALVPPPLASAPAASSTDLPVPSARATSAPSSSSALGSRGDLVREREVLDAARAALAHGQPDDAIVALQEHARRWPHGQLAEEREVVLIQALVAAGRTSEAQARAARFHQAFPKSIFAPAIDAALESAPAPR